MQAGDAYLESGAGSTMLKFGLLILLVNIFLKLALGFGLWNLALKHKNEVSNASPYYEEQIEAGNNEILRGANNNMNKRVFPSGEGGSNQDLIDNYQPSDE